MNRRGPPDESIIIVAMSESRPHEAGGQPNEGPQGGPTPPAPEPGARRIRVGTAERQSAVDALADHFTEGRLSQSEFEERTATAWGATTEAELAPLFSDLPGGVSGFIATGAAEGARRSANAPAQRADPAAAGDPSAPAPEKPASSRALLVLRAIIPLIAVALFFILMGAGVDNAWLAFLLIPIVYIAGGVLDGTHDPRERRAKRRERRDRRRG